MSHTPIQRSSEVDKYAVRPCRSHLLMPEEQAGGQPPGPGLLIVPGSRHIFVCPPALLLAALPCTSTVC